MHVCLVFGWLGAGKTTVLQRVIPSLPSEKRVFIVNDYSKDNVDVNCFGSSEMQTVEGLSGGCVCCNLLSDLVHSLQRAHREGVVYAFVECTGVADTSPIVSTVAALPSLKDILILDCVITVVNASLIPSLLSSETDEVSTLQRTQLLGANIVLINNWEGLPQASSLEVLQKWQCSIQQILTSSNPSCRVFFTNAGHFAFREIAYKQELFSRDGCLPFFLKAFGEGNRELGEFPSAADTPGEEERLHLTSFTLTHKGCMHLEAFLSALNSADGKKLLSHVWRSKGYFIADEGNGPKQFRWQTVGKRFDFSEVLPPYVSMERNGVVYSAVVVFLGDFDLETKTKEAEHFLHRVKSSSPVRC